MTINIICASELRNRDGYLLTSLTRTTVVSIYSSIQLSITDGLMAPRGIIALQL